MDNKTKDLISRIDHVQGMIDEINNQMTSTREDAITTIRDLLKGIDGHSIQLDNPNDSYSIAYEGRNGGLYTSHVKRVFLKEIDDSKSVWFELEDNIVLPAWEIFTEDIFEVFEMIFRAERERKIAYINDKVKENKPYALCLLSDMEIAYAEQVNPELVKVSSKKVDHIAFTDNEEDGAKVFVDFTNGVWLEDLYLSELTEIEIALAKGAYMAR